MPDNEHTYQYEDKTTVYLGGLEFLVNLGFMNFDDDLRERPGSDGFHVNETLRAEGCSMSGDLLRCRLVHLIEPEMRDELMVIYAESPEYTNSAAAASGEETAKERMAPVLSRSLSTFSITSA